MRRGVLAHVGALSGAHTHYLGKNVDARLRNQRGGGAGAPRPRSPRARPRAFLVMRACVCTHVCVYAPDVIFGRGARATAFVTPNGFPRARHRTMSKAPWTVCITGAAGQIGYALLPHICSGKTFGPDQPIKLHLLDLNIEGVQTALGGVKFELEDSTYPLLKGVVTTGDAKVIARRLANARLLIPLLTRSGKHAPHHILLP
jgi:hypothetical protein